MLCITRTRKIDFQKAPVCVNGKCESQLAQTKAAKFSFTFSPGAALFELWATEFLPPRKLSDYLIECKSFPAARMETFRRRHKGGERHAAAIEKVDCAICAPYKPLPVELAASGSERERGEFSSVIGARYKLQQARC